MTAYYNEHDPYAAQWLRNLIAAGHIAPGEVDERSVVDVRADDLRGFRQCHFFAGIGVWSHALRLAGWPDDREVWTGSCPCQPFSAAGKRGGVEDERHLWPEFFRLISQCRPAVIFGEQVASSDSIGKVNSKPRSRARLRDHVSPQVQGSRSCTPRETTGEEEGTAIRPLRSSVGDSSANRDGPLRTDGLAVQSGWWQNVGQSVAGQGRSEAGLPVLEPSRHLPWCEQCDWRLGREQNDRDGDGNPWPSPQCVECVVQALGRSTEGKNGPAWFDVVSDDLERAHYTVGAVPAPACGFGAPHIRQRLYFVADASGERCEGERLFVQPRQPRFDQPEARRTGGPRSLADMPGERRREARTDSTRPTQRLAERSESDSLADSAHERINGSGHGWQGRRREPADRSELGDTDDARSQGWRLLGTVDGGDRASECPSRQAGATNGFWRDADWLPCIDGKARPVEPGTFPLAHGATARVGRLRAYGNAINARQAQEFITAYMT